MILYVFAHFSRQQFGYLFVLYFLSNDKQDVKVKVGPILKKGLGSAVEQH